MRNRFYSKVDWWIGTILGVLILNSFIGIVKNIENNIIDILIIIFISWLLFGTYYEFKDQYLIIKSGPFKNKLLYNSITKINFKKSIVASATLSTDKIEIICNGKLGGYVSPKYKKEFIEILNLKCINLKL